LNSIKEFFGDLGARDWSTGGAALVAIALIYLMFKAAKFVMKLLFLLSAAVLIVGAYWWHTHK